MAGAGMLKSAEPARAVSEAEYRAFREWLFDCSGINLGPSKQALLTSRLGRRLSALGLPSYQAYLEMLRSGTVGEVGARIVEVRAEARARHGWTMDISLLREPV